MSIIEPNSQQTGLVKAYFRLFSRTFEFASECTKKCIKPFVSVYKTWLGTLSTNHLNSYMCQFSRTGAKGFLSIGFLWHWKIFSRNLKNTPCTNVVKGPPSLRHKRLVMVFITITTLCHSLQTSQTVNYIKRVFITNI